MFLRYQYFNALAKFQAEDPASSYVANRPMATDVGSSVVTSKVKGWLSDCLSGFHGHSKCSVQRELPCLPRRVIYVGDDAQHVKLQEGKSERAAYVALSYCWGGPQDVITTLKTLERNIAGLDVSSLPQTIIDAIKTTRNLGLKYLWVDALCIIQDSPLDKDREIKFMYDYYHNATVTLAAAMAYTVTAGFLHPRTPASACDLPLYLPNRARGKAFIITELQNEQPKEPLYTRGWALQEFLLSPRLLIFGSCEAIWQCQSTISSVLPSHISYDPSWPCKRLPLPSRTWEYYPDVAVNSTRSGIWQSIVENYTSRQLTLPEDRLPALAGIARQLEKTWGDTYVAGLWREQLLEQLLWTSNYKPHSIGAYRAPSWSWAAVDGRITFDSVGSKAQQSAEILDIDLSVRILGDVQVQRLRLFAVVRPLTALHNVSDVEDDGTLQFVLLGWNYVSAFGLIVRPVERSIIPSDEVLFTRVGMLNTWLRPQLPWLEDAKEAITIV
jgi:hypothetical protein